MPLKNLLYANTITILASNAFEVYRHPLVAKVQDSPHPLFGTSAIMAEQKFRS
jgi:hypothetical protein